MRVFRVDCDNVNRSAYLYLTDNIVTKNGVILIDNVYLCCDGLKYNSSVSDKLLNQ